MITPTLRSLSVLLPSLCLAIGLSAQTPAPKISFPAPSPTSTLKQRVGLTDIEITYSRPGVKDRRVFGELEPYGSVWRTGANSPTKVTFSTPVKFGGTEVPAGTYGLFSIPGEQEWTVILNKIEPKDWGAYNYKPDTDVARVTVKPVALADPVETFTIDVNDIRVESATLNLIWQNTRVPVKLEFDVVTQLKPQIEAVMASDAPKKPYFSAAMFYYEAGGDLHQALQWIDAAIKEQPEAFYMVYRKGLIQEKLGDKAGALASAQASREAASKAVNQPASLRDEYIRLNDALIARLK